MTRLLFFATAVASSVLFAGDAASQNLSLTITTTSQRGSQQLHTEHARPVAYRPFRSTTGTVDLTNTLDYRVTVTNSSPSDILLTPGLFRSDPFVNNVFCWGNDFCCASSPTDLLQDFTVPAGATRVLTGVEIYNMGSSIPLDSAPSGGCLSQDDGIHRPSGESRIFAGPTQHFGWAAVSPEITLKDAGTTFTTDMTVTTEYEFPLVTDTSVCDPLQPNSTGNAGSLAIFGDTDLSDGLLLLRAQSLPANSFAFTVISNSTQPAAPINFGQATLCLAGPQFRWLDSVALTDGADEYLAESAPNALPVPAPMAGSSLAFQVFHRDVVAGFQSANSTNAVVVTF